MAAAATSSRPLVLMLLVHTCRYVEGLRTIHKVEYDWTARKIHPLLVAAEAHTGQKLLTPRAADAGAAAGSRAVASDWVLNDAFLKAMLRANVDFCIKGDESGWRALIGTTDTAAAVFSTYQRKYAPFFVADYSCECGSVSICVRCVRLVCAC